MLSYFEYFIAAVPIYCNWAEVLTEILLTTMMLLEGGVCKRRLLALKSASFFCKNLVRFKIQGGDQIKFHSANFKNI